MTGAMLTACLVSIDESRLDAVAVKKDNATAAPPRRTPPVLSHPRDAASPSDAGACPGHLFCSNFDGPSNDPTAGWLPPTDPSPFAFDSINFVSPPHSLMVTVAPDDARTTALGTLVPIPNGNFHIELDVRMSASGDPATIELAPLLIDLEPVPTSLIGHSLTLVRTTDSTFAEYFTDDDGGLHHASQSSVPVALATWHHVAVDYTRVTSQAQFTVDSVMSAVSIATALTNEVFLEVGASFQVDLKSTWTINIDNVVIDGD
jgi:hypothetical protein